ncbi:MAG: type II toxin-antitoxin system VapC family toxin [Actinobacteria bacterium]|nr:type II toxin-antitoxin system VapC family toxin [Actinomycetota bacterium]
MTLAFWDSSAFVKLLVDEAGSEQAERLWNNPSPAAASRLVVPEVSAALAAAGRGGRITDASLISALREWRRFEAEIDFFELTPEVAGSAADLAGAHLLSGADAIHLATALALRDSELVLATWDRRLASAAAAEGLSVVPGGSVET